jgi:hypothetical protein
MRRRFLVIPMLLAAAGPARAADSALFQQLGDLDGIERIVGGMVDRSLGDPRIA